MKARRGVAGCLALVAVLAGCWICRPAQYHLAMARPSITVTVDNGARQGLTEDPHSGNLLAVGGTYYWYGDTYSCGFRFQHPETPWCGFEVTWSQDLVNWQQPAQPVDPGPWQESCRGFGCFRPKVVYNPTTRLFVLWFNTADSYRVMTSPAPTGPFTYASTPNLGDAGMGDYQGQPSNSDGDEGLYVDGDTGYVAYSHGGALMVERLTPDFLNGSGQPMRIVNFPELPPYYGVEAPSMFGRAGTYYITMSLPRCPYCTAATGVEMAPSPLGPWHYAGEISPDSCNAQPDGVTELPGGTYLYASDQWVQHPDWPYTNEADAKQFWTPLTFNGDALQPFGCPAQFTLTLPRLPPGDIATMLPPTVRHGLDYPVVARQGGRS